MKKKTNEILEENRNELNVEKETKKTVSKKKFENKFLTDTKEKTKGFFSGFSKFISKGNIIDLAIGVVIGTAFSAIVTSLVNDIIMPLVSILIGDINFKDLKWVLKEGTSTANGVVGEVAFKYGAFLQVIINFLIIALSIYIMYRIILSLRNRHAKKLAKSAPTVAPASKPEPPKSETLLEEILIELKKSNGTTLKEINSKKKKG